MQQLTKINVYPGTPNLGYYKPLEQGQVKTKWLLPCESNICCDSRPLIIIKLLKLMTRAKIIRNRVYCPSAASFKINGKIL